MDDVPQDPDQLAMFNVADLVGEILAQLSERQRARVLDQLARELS